MIRRTIICPAALRDDANDLMAVWGYSAADLLTLGEPVWQDADGALYCVASGIWDGEMTSHDRPGWDAAPYAISMAGAQRAWDAIEAGTILVLLGDDALALLAAAGLTRVDDPA